MLFSSLIRWSSIPLAVKRSRGGEGEGGGGRGGGGGGGGREEGGEILTFYYISENMLAGS